MPELHRQPAILLKLPVVIFLVDVFVLTAIIILTFAYPRGSEAA
jgi:hypothetical protein